MAAFIVKTRYSDLPKEVIELGKKSILDGVGLALAGSVAETGELSRAYVKTLGLAPGGVTVIGDAMRAPPRFAAFLNGLAMHADDYDDTQLAVAKDRVYGLLTHPTATALPPALAVAELAGRSGIDLLLAYHVGVEVECKIAEAIAPRHYGEGFHSTGTIGGFGSAAAVAKLRGFDEGRTTRALSIAGSQAAGLRENFGTMTKPFHAGRAAEAGIVAADLAGLGWTATDQILEAPRGFFRAAGGGFDPGAIVGKLGNPWTFADPGVSIKPHPSGSLTHPGMTELLRLIREHNIRAADVEQLEVGTNSYMPTALIHRKPSNALQAKFSMEFCMASLLLYGKAGLNEFTSEVVNRPEVQSLIARVRFGPHPEAEAEGYNKMTTILTLRLRGGGTITGRANFGKGSPANPMSYDEVAAKFLDCATFGKFPAAKANPIVEMIRKLETMRDVRVLTALCRR
ncbi:MAG: MmgE/PrpD family protein [Bryobacteraceae bacterium]